MLIRNLLLNTLARNTSMDMPLYANTFTEQHLLPLQKWLADPAVHRNLYSLYRPMSTGELKRWLEHEQGTGARCFFTAQLLRPALTRQSAWGLCTTFTLSTAAANCPLS